jgi:hypothetical protein
VLVQHRIDRTDDKFVQWKIKTSVAIWVTNQIYLFTEAVPRFFVNSFLNISRASAPLYIHTLLTSHTNLPSLFSPFYPISSFLNVSDFILSLARYLHKFFLLRCRLILGTGPRSTRSNVNNIAN